MTGREVTGKWGKSDSDSSSDSDSERRGWEWRREQSKAYLPSTAVHLPLLDPQMKTAKSSVAGQAPHL